MPNLDDILAQQSRTQLLVTIDTVEGESDSVKVTPWSPLGGCSCNLAITLPKDAIEGIIVTQLRHACCGKSFVVVEMRPKEDAKISVRGVLEQLVKAANQPPSHHHHEEESPMRQPQPGQVLPRMAVPCGQTFANARPQNGYPQPRPARIGE